jgi:tetratricopeptide (TPR) repeat protein
MRWTAMGAMGLLLAVGAAGNARADEPRPPQNVKAEPSTPASAELSSRSATAEMLGNPQEAVSLADRAIRVDPKDPWAYYTKGLALALLGEVNGAVAALVAAQQHFQPSDVRGRSVAVFGRAHVLHQAGRCDDAEAAYREYMALVRGNTEDVARAQRYINDCRASTPPPGAQTAGPGSLNGK